MGDQQVLKSKRGLETIASQPSGMEEDGAKRQAPVSYVLYLPYIGGYEFPYTLAQIFNKALTWAALLAIQGIIRNA